MKVYTTDKIRNIALLGHGGSGKTSLAEAMAKVSGMITRMGRIDDGNTISDYDKEEQKRKFSISTSMIPIEWADTKLNILDTPGYFDFVGEVEEAMSAAASAIIVVSAKAGVETGTIKSWELCERYKIPRLIYVSDMDIDHSSFGNVLDSLTERYGKKLAPFQLPIRENEKFIGYVDVLTEKAYQWDDKGNKKECPVPEDRKKRLSDYKEALMEAVAETSEEFMDKYFGGETFTAEEIISALRISVCDGSIVPVVMGSSISTMGVEVLMNNCVNYLPSPRGRKVMGVNASTGADFEADYDESKPKSAIVWKTIVDPFIGKYSLFKVNSGIIKSGDTLFNEARDAEERTGKLYVLCGNKSIEVSELHSGDIGAFAKLAVTKTGDSLSTKSNPIRYERPYISTPYTAMRYVPVNKGDVDKISQALSKISSEDMTLKVVNDSENRQTLLYGIGDQQLDVVKSRLENEYKVKIEVMKPKVAYRETIRGKSDVEGKYKKQTGGHGQYGHVKMLFEPSGDMTKPVIFEERVVGGAVPRNFFPAVEKGLADSVVKGPVAAYPVVGVKAILYDGSYHPVDSSEQSFKTAARMAFKDGFLKANPILLEPIMSLKVTVPDKFTGDVMGDLNKRRGRVLGMNPAAGGKQTIEAEIPQSCIYGYNTDLRSMTGGIGEFSYEFNRYEPAPADIQAKEIEARKDKLTDVSDD